MIWPTKYETWAVSLPGHSFPEFKQFGDAEAWEMMTKKLDAFCNIPINGGDLTRWEQLERGIRARHGNMDEGG